MKPTHGDRLYFGQDLFRFTRSFPIIPADIDKLRQYNLPLLQTEEELANWLNISLQRLRWFTHDRLEDTVWHYRRLVIPKRSGGTRVILAPKRELKRLQRTVLWSLLYRVQPTIISEAAHGFMTQRSIITNARAHIGKQIVLRMDLEDFFPSIQFPRVRDLLIGFGYSTSVASTLALLCTERERAIIVEEGVRRFRSLGPRHLVQGAPTSPALANLICHDLDADLQRLADEHQFTYTRYADDLIFSGDCSRIPRNLLTAVSDIIDKQGFRLNARKTAFTRRSSRQIVTGIVVNNEEPSTPRALRRRLRAILHNADSSHLNAQNRNNHPNFEEYLQGVIAFVESVNPHQGQPLREAFQRVRLTNQGLRGGVDSLSAPFTRRQNSVTDTEPNQLESDLEDAPSPFIPQVGDWVRHPNFGRGVVTKTQVYNDDAIVCVLFSYPKVGELTLDVRFARLKRALHKD